MTLNDTETLSSTAAGLSFNNVDAGTIQVNNATIDGQTAITSTGVLLNDSNASFTFDSDTEIMNIDGVDFDVNGGTGTINMQGDITNSDGLSVRVQNVTGGSVNFSAASSITDTGGGMRILNNTGGSFSFLGTNGFTPTINANAVELTSNTGASMTFAGLDINSTGTGQGFIATGGGTLSVTGTTNIIETDDGMGLHLEDMTIGTVDFQSVTVNDGSGGPANAIIMRDLTGGQVAIGPSSGAVGAGGVLRSTDDAIILENVQNVDLRRIQIVAAGDAANEDGIEITHTAIATTTMDVTIDTLQVDAAFGAAINASGADNSAFNLRLTNSTLNDNVAIGITGSGAFGLLVDNNDITTTAAGDTAFSLAFSGSAQNGDVTIRNGNAVSAVNATAFEFTTNGTNANIDFLLDANTFSNNSAGSETADIFVDGGATVNANIVNNTFTNAGAADEFAMESDGASTQINLDLDNNTSGGVYELTTSNNGGGFNFSVVDRDNTATNNTGTVNFNPLIAGFEDITGPVQTPTVP